MFNGLVINPAYAGNQPQLELSFIHRDQWVNFEGAPNLQTLIGHKAIENYPVGVGLVLTRDQVGVHEAINFYPSYAYQIQTPLGQLAFGLQAGFDYTVSNYQQLNPIDEGDELFLNNYSNFKPNFGTGIFFSNETTYAGISVPHILNNKIVDREKIVENVVSEARQARHYFLTGGHVFTLNNSIKFKPSALVRVKEQQPVGWDLNGNLFIDDVVNLGLSYRSGDAIIGLFEIILNENFSFSYAYDYNTSSIRTFAKGSHEVMIQFRSPVGQSTCHTYF